MLRQTNSPEGFPPDLLLELPSGGGRGLRQRLESALRIAIQQERLRGGAILPPSRVLAADLGIARSVVVEAYRNLAANGYLETRRGGWTRVRSHAQAERSQEQEPPTDYEQQLFFGWRRPAASDVPIRLLGGLPDPALFPRREWLRHYRAALAEVPYPALGYPDILGAEPLREALANYLARARGTVATPERILVCTGFTQALTLVCRTLRRSGARRILVEEPCHIWHRTAVEKSGLEPVPIAVDDRGLDPALLADVHADALLVAPAHSYPSGVSLEGARRQVLATWAVRNGALIIVYIGTASKTLTPALRLGWLVAPPRLIEPLAREKHTDDMGTGLLEQLALARFIASGAFTRHLRRIRPVYRQRRDATIATLTNVVPTAGWQGEAAGLHLYLTLPDHVDEHELARAAHARGVLLELGSWHWAASGSAPPSLVLGYGSVGEPAIRRAIKVIADSIAPR
jgi:GntR family transcriptional regulator/MocR family aminotransferase